MKHVVEFFRVSRTKKLTQTLLAGMNPKYSISTNAADLYHQLLITCIWPKINYCYWDAINDSHNDFYPMPVKMDLFSEKVNKETFTHDLKARFIYDF